MTSEMPGGKPEKKLISLRLPLPLLDEMDEFAWKNRTDRSDVIETACRFYVGAVICPICGTINAKNSKRCSICGVNLDSLDEWKKRLQADTDEFVLLQRRLAGLQSQLEDSSLSLEQAESDDATPEVVKKYFRLQIGTTALLIKEISTVLMDTGKIAQDILQAEALLNDPSPDPRKLAEMLRVTTADIAELDYLSDNANATLSYNKEMLDPHVPQ